MQMRAEHGFVIGNDHASRRADLVNALVVFFGDFHVQRFDIVFKLLHRSRANDRAGNARLMHAPRQRELTDGTAFSDASAVNPSTISNAASLPSTLGARKWLPSDNRPSGGCSPFRLYLPVNTPPPNGLQGIIPSP